MTGLNTATILQVGESGELVLPIEFMQAPPHTKLRAERHGKILVVEPISDERLRPGWPPGDFTYVGHRACCLELVAIVIVDLPENVLAIVFKRFEFALSMWVVIGRETVECFDLSRIAD